MHVKAAPGAAEALVVPARAPVTVVSVANNARGTPALRPLLVPVAFSDWVGRRSFGAARWNHLPKVDRTPQPPMLHLHRPLTTNRVIDLGSATSAWSPEKYCLVMRMSNNIVHGQFDHLGALSNGS